MDNPTTQAPSTITPPVTPLPEPKRKMLLNMWLWIVGVAALLGVGIVMGVFLGKQLYSKPVLHQPTPSPSITSVQEGNPTANWKTYTFQPIQLSLKVPPELTVHTEEPNPGNDFTAYIQNYPFIAPVPQENAYQLYIVWQKTPTITQTEFLQLKEDLNANTVENTVIASYPATKGQVKGERNRFVTYILKGDTKISLFTSEPTQTNKNLTDQILSTFRFVDQNSQKTLESLSIYNGPVSPQVQYQGLKFKEIDAHNFQPLTTSLDETDYQKGDNVFDGYTFTATQGEDFEFLAEENRESNPGSFIKTELYGYGPKVIKMDTRIGWGVPVTGRYFYVIQGGNFYGSGQISPDGRKYSKFGLYTLKITQRK